LYKTAFLSDVIYTNFRHTCHCRFHGALCIEELQDKWLRPE